MRYDTPLEDRRRKADYKRARYRMNPEQRLAAINRNRARLGYPTLSSLGESKKLRLPVNA